uniref:Ig-like domain-containing protein n=1 Tax=Macrostomum lignano TaxID=282301 RepID=A0A1I8JKY9_9PLAT
GSNLEVRCYLRYKGSELSTVSNQLQLCLPNGSCIAGHELNVGSAQPQHSGSYTCRFGAVNNSTIVKVLSASSAQLVAENSDFTVNCSVHCGMEKNCTDAADLQLCLPNNTCLPEARLTGSARPGSSASSPDQKVAENSSFTVSCELHYSGSHPSSLLNRMKLRTPAGTCSANHSVKIAMANPAHSGIYTCQINSTKKQARVSVLLGISFETSRTRTQEFSCTEIQMPTGLTGFMQYVAASLIGAFVTALVASAAVGLAIR